MVIETSPQVWLIVLAVVNIPIYLVLGKAVFNSWSGFLECIGICETLEGKLQFNPGLQADVFWEKMKMLIFLGLCVAAVFGEYQFLKKHSLLMDKITVMESSDK